MIKLRSSEKAANVWWNLHSSFWHYLVTSKVKFCGLLRVYELYYPANSSGEKLKLLQNLETKQKIVEIFDKWIQEWYFPEKNKQPLHLLGILEYTSIGM